MAYSAKRIAYEFLNLADKDKEELTHMKAQKLVYIAHGYCLAIMNKPLIDDEIQAWQYGPIIPNLYNEFKIFGKYPINIILDYTLDDTIESFSKKEKSIDNQQDKEFVKAIWDKYKIYSGPNLSDLTHKPYTPWHKTYEENHNKNIENNVIAIYYKNLINGRIDIG